MTGYWLKIVGGALAIFAIGMGIVTLTRRGVVRIKDIAESADPISIPTPFVPFRLDGAKLGTVEHVEVLRDQPKHVTGVNLTIDVPDTTFARLADECLISIPEGKSWNPTEGFVCMTEADTAGAGLAALGQVVLQSGEGGSIPLLLSQAAVDDLLRSGSHGSAVEVKVDAKAIRQSVIDAQIKAEAARKAAAEAKRLGDSVAAAAVKPPQ